MYLHPHSAAIVCSVKMSYSRTTRSFPHDRLSYFCMECQDEFRRCCVMMEHTPFYHPGGVLPQCVPCNNSYQTRMHQEQHRVLHTTIYKCRTCRVYLDQLHYHAHMESHRQAQQGTGMGSASAEASEGMSTLWCPIEGCEMQFSQQLELYKHATIHHYRCMSSNCCVVLKDFQQYVDHLREHPQYLNFCHICGKKFRSRDLIDAHYSSFHDIEEADTYPCYLCGLKYSARSALATHVIKDHRKPF